MAGLLDGWGDFIKTPEGQGLLSAVMGYAANARQGTPINNLGRGGMAGIMGYGGALDRQTQAAEAEQVKKYRDLQQQQAQFQMDSAKKKQEQDARISAGLGQFFKPAQPALAPLMGDPSTGILPSAGRAAVAPSFDTTGAASFLAQNGDYEKAISMLPKPEEAYTLGEGQARYKGGRVVAQGPEKKPSLPSAVQEYQFATQQGYKGTFEQWQNTANAAKAPKMSVDMRDPTAVAKAAMVFQNDYRAATKDSYQRAQAYESMMQAAADPSAKGDLTMVYSFIKALDPTSVVREGEIALVEGNRSIPDKVKGYAQKLATGQGLLPNERQDLINQARTLTMTDYKRSRNDIKAYRDNAKRLQLDPEVYAPDPYANFDVMGVNAGKPAPSILNVPQPKRPDPLGLFGTRFPVN